MSSLISTYANRPKCPERMKNNKQLLCKSPSLTHLQHNENYSTKNLRSERLTTLHEEKRESVAPNMRVRQIATRSHSTVVCIWCTRISPSKWDTADSEGYERLRISFLVLSPEHNTRRRKRSARLGVKQGEKCVSYKRSESRNASCLWQKAPPYHWKVAHTIR